MDRIGWSERRTVQHVEAVAEQAKRLVEREMRARVREPLTITVTDTHGVWALSERAERESVGLPSTLGQVLLGYLHRPAKPLLGRLSVSWDGLLLLVNAEAHKGDLAEVNVTLVHELVHAVQLSAPGARDARLAQIRSNYGVQRFSRREAKAANRVIQRHEEQARVLEHLAAQLA
ncbi:hypothetical protein AB0C81_12575 [Streptomyces roseoverticillatus]|uniref:hypothetical protein n=1 Tax=Streptomyces roseoverticillatus TaxID=66429 RepID=UPI0033DDD48F